MVVFCYNSIWEWLFGTFHRQKSQATLHGQLVCLSLVVADFVLGVAIFPMGHLCSILAVCNKSVYVTLHWFFLHSSDTNLGILTWDRYINIVHSFRYPNSMTSRSPGIVICMSWVIPLIISLAVVVGMHATNSYKVWKISRITGVSIFDISACVLVSHAVARILVVARATANGDSTFRNAVRSLEIHEGYNCFSKKTAPIFKRKKHGAAYFIIALVALFLVCHAIIIDYLALCFTFSCKLYKKGPEILTLFLV